MRKVHSRGVDSLATLEYEEPAQAQLIAVLVATALMTGCGTTEPMDTVPRFESQVESTGEPSVAPALPDTNSTFTPIAMIEPDTEIISEISIGNDNDTATTTAGQQPVGCSADASVMQDRLLQLINDARSVARACGNEDFAAARGLSWNSTLAIAAQKHSNDMATHDFFSHTGSDGSSAAQRTTQAGYEWRAVGENIAAGRATAADTVADWLNSPGHCRNIMNPSFFEMAVTCAEDSATEYERYWTNVLAAPR